MYQDNLFALDLSKKSSQGALFDKSHQVRFNREFSPKKLVDWLSRQQPLTTAGSGLTVDMVVRDPLLPC